MTNAVRPILPLALLKPGSHKPRWTRPDGHGFPKPLLMPAASVDLDLIREIATKLAANDEPLVLDLETRGTNPASDPDFAVVGIGLGTSEAVCYFGGTSPEDQSAITSIAHILLDTRVPLVAHNVAFDATALTFLVNARERGAWRDMKRTDIRWHNWRYCTYAMYRHLASEGFLKQKWGLKQAELDLLGWEESNEVELDQWLLDNGHKMQHGAPDKSQMWRAPFDILGQYCALDVEATWLLLNEVLAPAYNQFEAYWDFHTKALMDLEFHVVWQKLAGVTVNATLLDEYRTSLVRETASLRESFLRLPRVEAAVQAWNSRVLGELLAKEPTRYKKRPPLGAEPRKYRIDGQTSGTWLKWEEKRVRLESSPGEQSAHWTTWNQKVERMRELLADFPRASAEHDEEVRDAGLFNLNSGDQKRHLFYEALGNPVLAYTDNESDPKPAVDEDALRQMGEEGKALVDYNVRLKVLSYVESYLQRTTRYDDRPGEGRLHIGLKIPGTYTGRCGGEGGVNLQNIVKDQGTLECFVPPKGHKLVTFDVVALEPYTLAGASLDPGLMGLYGPNAKPNDVYLYTGAQLGGELERSIRSTGYDPHNPTKEALSRAKKESKRARSIAKELVLSSGYGAGPGKIRESLGLQGIEVSLDETRAMHRKYWEIYGGVKQYERELVAQWERNGGWILNPLGLPQCVAKDYIKDIVNRSIQGAGHSVFMFMTHIVGEVLEKFGIDYRPYIWDIHDCVMLTVPEERAEETKRLMDTEVMRRLNELMAGPVAFRAEANIVDNWWQDKME